MARLSTGIPSVLPPTSCFRLPSYHWEGMPKVLTACLGRSESTKWLSSPVGCLLLTIHSPAKPRFLQDLCCNHIEDHIQYGGERSSKWLGTDSRRGDEWNRSSSSSWAVLCLVSTFLTKNAQLVPWNRFQTVYRILKSTDLENARPSIGDREAGNGQSGTLTDLFLYWWRFVGNGWCRGVCGEVINWK